MQQRITIITTSQPSLNPRAVKEASALAQAGFAVSFVYTVTVSWADEMDLKLIQQHSNVNWVQAGKSLHQFPNYNRYVRLRRKINEIGFKAGFKRYCADHASVLLGQELYKCARQIHANLVVAHNLGALPAAFKISKEYQVPLGFDAEDFHRGESADKSFHWKHAKYIEDSYFGLLSYLTVSSKLIGDEYKKLYPGLKVCCILNVFPLSYLQPLDFSSTEKNDLKIFWFSQTIGRQRGLEDIIFAIGKLPKHLIELTLVGNLNTVDEIWLKDILAKADIQDGKVKCLKPVNENELPKIAAGHHIGLASEVTYCKNRELCLTNKIFIYLMAGNAILFSETPSQYEFSKENKGVSLMFKTGDIRSLVDQFKWCIENKDLLHQMRKKSIEFAATKYNWEIEKKKLMAVVNKLLRKNQHDQQN